MSITNWPIEDRPREKLLSKGAAALTDAELVAILLQTGVRGKTALDVAKDLLGANGNIKKLLSEPSSSIIKKSGLGQAKYATLIAAIELGRRHLIENIPTGTILNSSVLTQQFLADQLRHHTNEVFACIFMDSHFRLIQYQELFHGTVNEANVYPREIVKRCLAHNAAKIIIAHNHPSGSPLPSKADKELTKLIKQALAVIDIVVIDHIVIGNPHHFSFAEAGLMW